MRAMELAGLASVLGTVLATMPAGAQCTTVAETDHLVATQIQAFGEFGHSVAISGDLMVVGQPNADTTAGADAGAVWVYRRSGSTWVLETSLTPNDSVAGARFGFSVAAFGDYVAVGAPGHAGNIGTAYVFRDEGDGTWVYWRLGWGESGDQFGFSVALGHEPTHNYLTCLVGSPFRDLTPAGGPYVNAGVVTVFTQSFSGPWGSTGELAAWNYQPYERFGFSVAIDGDTAVVGAPSDATPAGPDSGAAWVFHRTWSGTYPTWSIPTQLTAPDAASGDVFGISVAIAQGTIAVGASTDDTPAGVDAGSVHLFNGSGTSWSHLGMLTAGDGAPGDEFGRSLALSGDDLVIGTHNDDAPAGTNAGAAYVFGRSGTSWTQRDKLVSVDPGLEDHFGWSVGVSDDTIVAGAFWDRVWGAVNAGSAHVFTRTGSSWSPDSQLAMGNRTQAASYGYAVAVAPGSLVVGVPWDDRASGQDAGSVRVYPRIGGILTLPSTLVASDGSPGAAFGWTVAVSGDTVAVGAELNTGTGPGSVYVFTRAGSTWSQQKLSPIDGAPGDQFGYSVAVDADTVVVGAPSHDTPSGAGAGAVYIFVRGAGGVWTPGGKLAPIDAGGGDFFGASVGIVGDTVVVGAIWDDTPAGSNVGSAYVFARSGTVWTQQAKLTALDATPSDQLGWSAAISGNFVVVGAPWDNGSQSYGSAYVFTRSGTVWTQQAKLTASDAGGFFGGSVAIDGDTAVVGAPSHSPPAGLYAGSAYVFTRSGTVWTQQAKLLHAQGSAGDEFGTSVGVAAGQVVVGVPKDETNSTLNSGSVFVYSLVPGPPPMPSTVKASEISAGVVKVTWKDLAPCETAFEFLREMKVGGTWTGASVVGSSPALPGTGRKGAWQQSPGPGAWRYSARAINAAGPSAWSAPAVVKPAAPTGLAAVWVAGGNGHNVKLTWVDNSGLESGSKFKREMQSGSSWINGTTVGNGQIGANATMFTDTTITTPGVYRYRLQTFNNATNSAWTTWVQITVP